MSQATLGGAYRNSNLFSNYYLDEKVYGLDAWDCDEEAQAALDSLRELYAAEGSAVEAYDEDNLRSRWVDEVLDVLGYETLNEASMPKGGGAVDRLLLDSETDARDAAMLEQAGDHVAMYKRGMGILEAKQWGADFSQKFSEGRNYRDASHQIKYYLERTPEPVRWGILTDGKKWRLYGTKDYETETYYEVDLQELLESGTLEEFKRFFVFFRAEALRESGGTTLLDEVWSESETAAQELGEDLQDDVFTALRIVGRGFIEYNDLDIDSDDDAALDELKEQSLVLLYRLMFLLYAEARDLINPDDPDAQEAYEEDYSLDSLRQDIHERMDGTHDYAHEFSDVSPKMWDRLTRLFDLIDTGNEKLGVPAYNGGLFDEGEHAFLAENDLPNRHLAEALHRISTTTNGTGEEVLADYADLDTRHLGSIYEGLLEHQFRVAPEPMAAVREDGAQVWQPADEVTVADAVESVDAGDLYVVNDDGERKATGAYYTPDYVVSYIVEETIDPLLDDIREDVDGAFRSDTQYVQEFMKGVKELEILDPAMGSGHFLTAATSYLTEQVMAEAREREVTVFDESHIRRTLAKECIYGVDVNEMAVELAKLSMWLETLAADQPLAFLDHHLKCGNSLVGADIEEIEELESDASADDSDQSSLAEFGATRRGTMEHLMDVYQEFLAIENEDLEDVKAMERKYAEIENDELRQRLVAMANVRVAEDFGAEVPSGAYERMAGALDEENRWVGVEDEPWFQEAVQTANRRAPFHWRLEFPEVFYQKTGTEQSNPGFDAVVGNPPYVRIYRGRIPEEVADYYRTKYATAHMKFDLYILFLDLSLSLLNDGGHCSQIVPDKFLNAPYGEIIRRSITSEGRLKSVLDLRNQVVFDDASVENVIPVFTKSEDGQEDIQIREKHGNQIGNTATLPISIVATGDDYSFRIRKSIEDAKLIKSINNNSINLSEIFYTNWGLRTGTKEKTDKFVVEETDDPRAKPMVRGKDIVEPYRLQPPSEKIIYTQDELYNPMFPELFENEKLIFRKITGEGPMGVADESGTYCFSTLIPCVNQQYVTGVSRSGTPDTASEAAKKYTDIYFALAIANSSLVGWYYEKEYSNELCVVPNHINQLPIPKIEKIPEKDDEKISTIEQEYNQYLTSPSTDERRILNTSHEGAPLSAGDEYHILSHLAKSITDFHNRHQSLNLHLPDYLGTYDDGPTLADLGPIPPEGRADSLITETEDTTEKLQKLRIADVTVERDGDTLTLSIVPYIKPEDPDEFEQEPNARDYITLDPVPAMRFTDLDDDLAALIEAFVPYAVDEAGGFAGFRDNATSTISPLDRLEALTLPALDDVREGLETYREQVEQAEDLDEKIERTDALIDEIVYDLYGLTDEEIEIVEEAVGD
jgi:type I restriction-modification system DNA methylase subunit